MVSAINENHLRPFRQPAAHAHSLTSLGLSDIKTSRANSISTVTMRRRSVMFN